MRNQQFRLRRDGERAAQLEAGYEQQNHRGQRDDQADGSPQIPWTGIKMISNKISTAAPS